MASGRCTSLCSPGCCAAWHGPPGKMVEIDEDDRPHAESPPARAGWMDVALLRGGVAGCVLWAGRMVCLIEEAVVESAGVDFRAGLDAALHRDGGGSMDGVATRRLGQTTPAAAHF